MSRLPLPLHSRVTYWSKLLSPSHRVFSLEGLKDSNMQSTSQQLLQLNGFITGSQSGSFTLLPLATRSVTKLIKLIDSHMHEIGGHKVVMPSMIPIALWKRSERFEENKGDLFTLNQNDLMMAPTHEEVISQVVTSCQNLSYKHFPLYLYQIGGKFRNEMRPKSGLLRAREFIMKDMYTYDIDDESAWMTYDLVCGAYDRIFDQLNLKVMKAEAATGFMGGVSSHEYHLECAVGQDTILICSSCGHHMNKEIVKDDMKCRSCESADLTTKRGIEVGHCYLLGTQYTEPFEVKGIDPTGKLNTLIMGCFGLGVTRLIAAAIEVNGTDGKMVWPSLIAPFDVTFISPKSGSKEEQAIGRDFVPQFAHYVAEKLGLDVAIDDRTHMSIGRRDKDHFNRGIPCLVIAGKGMTESIPRFEVIIDGIPLPNLMSHSETVHFLSTRPVSL